MVLHLLEKDKLTNNTSLESKSRTKAVLKTIPLPPPRLANHPPLGLASHTIIVPPRAIPVSRAIPVLRALPLPRALPVSRNAEKAATRHTINNRHQIRTIIQVYLKNVQSIDLTPGFGDYLRGAIYLYRLQLKYNFKLKLDYSQHPISQYISNDSPTPLDSKNNLQVFEDLYWWSHNKITGNDLISFMHIIFNSSNDYRVFTNRLYSGYIAGHILSVEEQEFMKRQILPSDSIKSKVDAIVDTYIEGYNILHIRSGDDTLINGNNNVNHNFYSIVESNLSVLQSLPVIVISDSIQIREELHKLYGFYISGYQVEHSGKANNDLEGTVIEFFLMSRSKTIFSLSVYEWGSTFSTMASAIYNVPLIRLS
jgi:hypothetical protein